MGKSRQSSAGGGGVPQQPRETPEEFQKRYDDAKKTLEEWSYISSSGKEVKVLSKPQVEKLLKAVLNEDIHFVGTNGAGGKGIVQFEERFNDGSSVPINFKASLIKDIVKGDGQKINDLMDEFGKLPEIGKKGTAAYNFGNTGSNFNGGFWNPSSNTVNINSKLFTDKTKGKEYTSEWCKHVLQHETTHSLDNTITGRDYNFITALTGDAMATSSSKFTNMVKDVHVSTYTENVRRNNPKHYEAECLADLISSVRLAKTYGASNVHMNGRGGQTVADWAKESKNKELYKFAEDFISCKNENELRELFEL